MWKRGDTTMTSEELLQKILRNKPYFKRNHGGVTFSGGEPILQKDFLIEISKKLKEAGIHIALDTCGVGVGGYKEILDLVDLVLFDIKYTTEEGYQSLAGHTMEESEKFIEILNQSGKPVWIRQVMVPGMMDTEEYLQSLSQYIHKIKNVEKIEFLPFHHLGFSKYEELGIPNPLKNTPEMKPEESEKCYQKFLGYYEKG